MVGRKHRIVMADPGKDEVRNEEAGTFQSHVGQKTDGILAHNPFRCSILVGFRLCLSPRNTTNQPY